jgi:hypothetical protein
MTTATNQCMKLFVLLDRLEHLYDQARIYSLGSGRPLYGGNVVSSFKINYVSVLTDRDNTAPFVVFHTPNLP